MKYRFSWKKYAVLWPTFVGLAFFLFMFDGVDGVFGGVLAAVYGFVAGYSADKFSREPIPVKVKNDAR